MYQLGMKLFDFCHKILNFVDDPESQQMKCYESCRLQSFKYCPVAYTNKCAECEVDSA
jgi:hypothetical protein